MPETTIVIYRDKNGYVPLLEWLDEQDRKVRVKCIAVIDVLGAQGYEVRRPTGDYLRDGIYELRMRVGRVNYRILYGFCGTNAVLLSHGCTKEATMPSKEIERAIANLKAYRADPVSHTYTGGI